MRHDLWRLIACIATALVIGLIVGRPFLLLSACLLLFVAWYSRALSGFLNYIRHNADDALPDLSGIVNDLVREFHILRSNYRQREEKLSGFLTRFQDAASALPDAVVVLNRPDRIEWANRKASEYLGINWPQDGGQRLANLIRHPDLSDFLRQRQRHLTSGVMELVSPEDEHRRLELRLTVYGRDHALLVARDITELQRLNKMRSDFIANASHELRTPLTVISGYLEAFEGDREHCPEEWTSRITEMRNQAGRMQRLIEDLLKLSSLESTAEPDVTEQVRVADMLAAIVREAASLEGYGRQTMETKADPELALWGSQAELYSAFSNIIFNAVQYTPAGGRIDIRWFGDREGARLEVSDNGEGIAPEHLSRLTERFYRADKSRSRAKGGTGLGLAIVKHVLARHDGTLEIRSEPGRGSTFTCHFPPERVVSARESSTTHPASA
ncbi:MAG: phosphate regulon sensor histidine kinase PhoR [Gammaproteobacteria bacterium]|nr:phosphate regulon sensor histidine kinase PhoR [Gammaproteobacteria bacterium]